MKKLGQFLKEKRKEKRYSLRDLEKRAGVTHPHIRYIEEGIRKPTFEVVMKLLNALNAEVSEFMIETGYMKPIKQWGKVKRAPVISWVQAGAWKKAYDPGTYSEFVETATKGEFALYFGCGPWPHYPLNLSGSQPNSTQSLKHHSGVVSVL